MNGGVCLPRKKKVVEDGVILEGTDNKKTFKCLRCGKEYDVAMGHFYRITYSPLFKLKERPSKISGPFSSYLNFKFLISIAFIISTFYFLT